MQNYWDDFDCTEQCEEYYQEEPDSAQLNDDATEDA